jgi:hypothetical protein
MKIFPLIEAKLAASKAFQENPVPGAAYSTELSAGTHEE